MTIIEVAAVCHDANRSLCKSLGDNSQSVWEEAPDWQKESAVKGVEFCLANPEAPPSANHESWLDQKLADGWVYGPVKDVETKTHPCIVPYADLPVEQQAKDHLFKAIVAALACLVSVGI
jgi:hypothetical protein